MGIYDDDSGINNSLTGGTGRNRRQNPDDNTPQDSQAQPQESAGGTPQHEANLDSPLAKHLRDQRIGGALGKIAGDEDKPWKALAGGAAEAMGDKTLGETIGDVKNALNDKEGKGYYNPESDEGRLKQASRFAVGQVKSKAKFWIGGSLASIFGGAAFFIIFGLLSGPLQFIHMGKAMEEFHLSLQSAQTGMIALKLARNVKHVASGQREKTRMGWLGNRYANRVTRIMESKGLKAEYRSGVFRGYTIEPSKLDRTKHPGLRSTEPAEVQRYFSERYGVNVTSTGGNLRIQPTGNYFKDLKMMNGVMRSAKLGALAPLHAHIAKVRMGFSLNPMRYWITQKDAAFFEKFDSKAARFKEWARQRASYLRNGVTTAPISATSGSDKDGKPTGEGDADQAQKTASDGEEVGRSATNGDDSAYKTFRDGIGAKAFGGLSAIVGILCLIRAIGLQADFLFQNQVELPMIRAAFEDISFAAALEYGDKKDIDNEFIDFKGELLYDTVSQTDWSQAKSIQANFGQAQTGPDLPDELKLRKNPGDMPLFRAVNALPGIGAACSEAGMWAMIIVGGLITGPFSAIFGIVTSLAAGPAMNLVVDQMAKLISGTQLPTLAAGALKGGIIDTGSYLGANALGQDNGGVPQSTAEGELLRSQAELAAIDDFNSKPLAYRLFNPNDRRTLAAKAIDSQAPDPAANVARVATGLLSMGRNLGSMIFRPLIWNAHAADEPYDYGRPRVSIHPAELSSSDPTFENLYANADLAADLLDQNSASTSADSPDNYIYRAKACFGVDIAKVPVTDENGQQYEQYAVQPPTAGVLPPKYKDLADEKNKCDEGWEANAAAADAAAIAITNSTRSMVANGRTINYSNAADVSMELKEISPWERIRMFIASSQTMNAWVCNMTTPDDEVGVQACNDTGADAISGAGAATVTAGT